MKKIQIAGLTALTLLGSLTAVQAASATTDPVGYVTTTLKADSFTLVGITLHEATEATGAFETVSGTSLTDTDIDFSALLEADTTYILEITSGDAAGVIQEITSTDASTNVLSTPDDLTALGAGNSIANGDSYKIRKAATISSIFGASNSAGLNEGTSLSLADVIWVQNGSGAFDKYFYHSGQTIPFPITEGWKNSSLTDVSNTPLIYTDGLMIQNSDITDNTLTITGTVVNTSKKIEVTTGFNLLGTVYPVGTTLASSDLNSQIQQGSSLSTADVIWMSDGAGDFNKYFYHVGQTIPFPIAAGWKNVSLADSSTQQISGAIFIERHTGDITITTPSY